MTKLRTCGADALKRDGGVDPNADPMAGGRSPRPTTESPTLTLPGSPSGWVGFSFGLVAEFFPNWLRAAWMQNLLLQSRPQPAPLGLVLFCSSHGAARPRHRPGHWEEHGARAGGVPRLASSAESATRVDRQLQTIGQLTSRSLLHPTPPRSSRPFRLRFSILGSSSLSVWINSPSVIGSVGNYPMVFTPPFGCIHHTVITKR
ncbi:PREDICTED: uncharacterized protein LOC108522781 [Rhinopithecus bieti]|uniref:uncharacterized protein LOC108522781 n=1 Tax=Rhinopithecus bieti TaxID=61621 RepID=UPI00083C3FBA|nr:PREDICTED: uncharacterized protein LOC108522781 [Rhinopithecus bieti]